ncbi:uncharacterized protein LOC112239612 [Oncorhynchus tshawytscha]|uniref:uncharacterized protein LOC112239612 n=1 Tax=Oncorhynchus tshawytscha TaxID=74940 RepID=UPI001C3CD228|nr:uncharacterized protein LOC112239612 [Oncorhynchus tshawytscha]
MGLPALGLIPFLGPLAFPVALGTVAVGGFILIKAIHKKPSYHPGSPIITRSVKVKSNEASGNEPTGNAASKKTEGQPSSNETTIIIAYGLGVVDTYKNVKKGRPSQFGLGNFGMAEADHIPPLASLRIARNHERLDRLLQVNPRLHEMIMSLDYDPTGQNLLTMRVLYQDHRDALTTGNSRESQVSSHLLAETIVDGDAALMLRKAFIMGHPISSWQLREDAGLAAPYTDGNIDMSDEGTRHYYRCGYIELVEAYHRKGIINKNQAKQLISWVEKEMHLDRDTQEYKEILDYIKRHVRVFRW